MATLLTPGFLASVADLIPNEQARANEFVLKFSRSPESPGISLERVVEARSADVWSGRISRELRAIIHKDGDTWLLLYAAHHDAAYEWARRRHIGRHPCTGGLQIVETVESVQAIPVAEFDAPTTPAAAVPGPFADHSDDYLLSLGVPASWLPTLRKVANEDALLGIIDHLPEDVAERLLRVADGELVAPPPPIAPDQPITASPDTRARFYVVDDGTDLLSVLEAPMQKWLAFLHPSQRSIVEGEYTGPAKVSGSAGTGKTVVAMHRARRLARNGQRVLLTSFVRTLCENLTRNLSLLCSAEERDRIRVTTVHEQALATVREFDPGTEIADRQEVELLVKRACESADLGSETEFVLGEWEGVVRRQGVFSWTEYRQARRTGRGRAMSARDRKRLWDGAFAPVIDAMRASKRLDSSLLAWTAAELLAAGSVERPFDAVIVDEVQDLTPPELRFLRELSRENPGGLLLVGDAGQRIYPGGYSLTALGIETRGRSTILRINYRTTEQIRRVADSLLSRDVDDFSGGRESRAGTHSLLGGPAPRFAGYPSAAEEDRAIVAQVRSWLASGMPYDAVGVFGRAGTTINRVREALASAGIPCHSLARDASRHVDAVHFGTMHRAKGLEFRAVVVAGCSAAELPSPSAMRAATDPQDREDTEALERRLLYVAMTRARDELLVTWSGEPSPFLGAIPGIAG